MNKKQFKRKIRKLTLKKEELTQIDVLSESLTLEQLKKKKCKHGKSLLWCSQCKYKGGFLEIKQRDLIDDLKIPDGYKLEKAFGINKFSANHIDKNKLHLEFDDE